MPRRANGDGTKPRWDEQRQRFEKKITVGDKRQTIRAKTIKELNQMERDLQRAHEQGVIDPGKLNTGTYILQWVELYGNLSWGPGTAGDHERSIRLHIIPHIGEIPLKKLGVDDIQRMINAWTADGMKPSSVRKALQPLRGALEHAADDGKILKNPVNRVKLPKLGKSEMTFFTRHEAALYASALPDSNNGRLLAFILRTGLRKGEAIGLQWQDIGENAFKVQRTVRRTSKIGGGTELYINNNGKTDNAIRTIPLNDQMRALLADQRSHQMQQRLKAGPAWQGGKPGEGDTWVFANEIGLNADSSNLRRTHDATLKKIGLDGVDIHGLRHTFATHWVEHGGNVKNLAAILGHADATITLNRYVHPVLEQMQAEVVAMGGLY